MLYGFLTDNLQPNKAYKQPLDCNCYIVYCTVVYRVCSPVMAVKCNVILMDTCAYLCQLRGKGGYFAVNVRCTYTHGLSSPF